MTDTNMSSMLTSDLINKMADFFVEPKSLDTAGDQKETIWQSMDWQKNLGYYKTIPELKTAIDTKATWTIGAGFTADPITTLLLGTIKGNGKDTFNSIIKNMIKIKVIDGDAYAEIIRNDAGILINLKPLNPSRIKSVWGGNGRIIRYEQISTIKGHANKLFKPDEIFHLMRNRIADEIHGVSIIPAVEWIIKARNEAMQDWKTVMHRNVSPVWIFHLDTDDETVIANFKTKMDEAHANGENLYVPKGAVVPEMVATATNASLNPLTWIAQLNDYFFQVINTPQIIIGNAKEFTDASGKIVYLSYEQSVKAEQLSIEEQVLAQLNIEIKLTFPASLQQEAISDTPNPNDQTPDATTLEEEPHEQAAQPNDTKTELEGKK